MSVSKERDSMDVENDTDSLSDDIPDLESVASSEVGNIK